MKRAFGLLHRRGVVTFLFALVAGLVVTEVALNYSPEHTVALRFANANGLVAGNDVTWNGNAVGTVKSVSVDSSPDVATQSVDVSVSLDSAVWPLRQGTRFSIRPHGVLGNMYVELNPGGAGAQALDASHVFGLSETSSPVNLDELTNVFTPTVRTAIHTQLQQGTIMFGDGGAANLNQTIANANPLVADALPITDVLSQRSPQLDRLNTEFDTVSSDLAKEDAGLRGLISSADTTLAAIASRQQQLQGALDGAAGTFTSLDQSLAGEQKNLENIFRSGPAVLDQTHRAVETLIPLIGNLNPHIPSLDALLQEFVTATGFTTGTGGIDTLRVDGTLPPSGDNAYECGGQPRQQKGVC
jgi:phospholipid/cholesterol/gamma-HCH transport system substrate-binding protein